MIKKKEAKTYIVRLYCNNCGNEIASTGVCLHHILNNILTNVLIVGELPLPKVRGFLFRR